MIVPSHLKSKSPKLCKCGHLKDDHKSNPKSKFSSINDCHKCQCSEYMNRKLPTKFSLVSMFIGCIFIGFIIFASIMIYQSYQAVGNKTINMPVQSLLAILIGVFLLGGLQIFNLLVYPYFEEKKRRSFPIDNRSELI